MCVFVCVCVCVFVYIHIWIYIENLMLKRCLLLITFFGVLNYLPR